MIPLTRPALSTSTLQAMERRTNSINTVVDKVPQARIEWSAADSVRKTLRAKLSQVTFRAAFCMYCHESRGTDVDHFDPIMRSPLSTFDWNNHVLACSYCNQQAKREQFPVDGSGSPILINPFSDDSVAHLSLGPSGEYVELSNRGAETIEKLRLNVRRELVIARATSWATVIEIFSRLASGGTSLSTSDVDRLLTLPIVDAFHHFAHYTADAKLERRAVSAFVAAAAVRELPSMRVMFPRCAL